MDKNKISSTTEISQQENDITSVATQKPYTLEEYEKMEFSDYSLVLKIFIATLIIQAFRLIISTINSIDDPLVLLYTIPTNVTFFAFITYTIVAFLKQAPNAVFLGKAYLIFLLLSDIILLFMDNLADVNYVQIGGSVLWIIIWFLYFHFSEDVFPKSFRRAYKFDYFIVGAQIVIPIILSVISVFSHVAQSPNNPEMIKLESLSEGEYTDGYIAFKVPENCICEKQKHDGIISSFIHDDNIRIIIVSGVYLDIDINKLLDYRNNWESDEWKLCPSTHADEVFDIIDGIEHWKSSKCYYIEEQGLEIFWDYMIISDKSSNKTSILSCYYSIDESGTKDAFIKSIRFK